jgi:hypothetical protein
MSIGGGIAVAGWFIAFVWACTVSENTAAGVVIGGIIVTGCSLANGERRQ